MDNDKFKYCNTCMRRDVTLKRCSKCHVIFYCSVECQRKDWPSHKVYCSKTTEPWKHEKVWHTPDGQFDPKALLDRIRYVEEQSRMTNIEVDEKGIRIHPPEFSMFSDINVVKEAPPQDFLTCSVKETYPKHFKCLFKYGNLERKETLPRKLWDKFTVDDVPLLVFLALDEVYMFDDYEPQCYAGLVAMAVLRDNPKLHDRLFTTTTTTASSSTAPLFTQLLRVCDIDPMDYYIDPFRQLCIALGWNKVLPYLKEYLLNKRNWVYGRMNVVDAIAAVGKKAKDTQGRKECIEALSEVLSDSLNENPDFNGTIVSAFLDMEAVEAHDVIRRAYDLNTVDIGAVGGYGHVLYTLGLPVDKDDPVVKKSARSLDKRDNRYTDKVREIKERKRRGEKVDKKRELRDLLFSDK